MCLDLKLHNLHRARGAATERHRLRISGKHNRFVWETRSGIVLVFVPSLCTWYIPYTRGRSLPVCRFINPLSQSHQLRLELQVARPPSSAGCGGPKENVRNLSPYYTQRSEFRCGIRNAKMRKWNVENIGENGMERLKGEEHRSRVSPHTATCARARDHSGRFSFAKGR